MIIAEAQDLGELISVFRFPVDSLCNFKYIPHFLVLYFAHLSILQTKVALLT